MDIIVENKHREIQTELIKRLLRENTRLSEVAERAIAKLSAQPEKVHSYHLNRFIQINNRYPKASIEQFLLQHIGCERNPTPAKINQRYLIHDLSKLLEKVPKKPCEELLLKPIRSEDREKLIEIISDIFEKLLYLPIKKFDKLSMKVVEEEPENEDWNTESDDE